MTYFNLRKPEPEPEPEETAEEEAPAAEEQQPEKRPAKEYGPLLTGLFGPGRWIAARFGAWTALGVHVVSVWAVAYYGGWIAAGVLLAWLWAVLLFTPKESLNRASDWIERRGWRRTTTPPPEPRNAGDREGALRMLYTVLGEAPGVHLRTVLAYLQEHGQWEGRTVADLRQHLQALGIPVQPKVKVDGTPTRGVLKADLDALSPIEETEESPAPSPTV